MSRSSDHLDLKALKPTLRLRASVNGLVSAFYGYVPHLAHREEIYEFPVPWKARNGGAFEQEGERLGFADEIEVVVVPPDSLAPEDRAILDDLRTQFDVVHDEDGILVLERTTP